MRDGDSTQQDVTARLTLLRVSLGYESQTAFATRSGIDSTEWNHFERGRRPLSLTAANKLRQHWRVTLDWLFHGDRSGLTGEVARTLPLLDDWRRERA